jgi:hypothetical protein
MTTFQDLYSATLEGGLARVKTRPTPDLPDSITDTAVWMQPEVAASGTIPPPTYHALSNGYYYPVEFVNSNWHWLEWDDEPQFLGYWSRPTKRITQGTYGLGWLGRAVEAPTPKAMAGPSFSTARERAESASTQPQGEQREPPDDEDFVDTNPVQTQELAEQFEDNPVFGDIAEAIEPSQDRGHYLPTTLPSATGLRPVTINPKMTSNPIKVRSTTVGHSEAAAATHETTKLITNAIKMDGQLKGRVPEPFDGDRSKTQTFMNAFDLYWMTNEESSLMRTPYRRCTFFLGLLEGPKVEDWVVEQAKELREKVNR